MEIRNAKISDVSGIHELVNYYAELDRMLFRSMADIYEKLQTFVVAELDGQIVGCCSLEIIWADLAEIKSLAVRKGYQGKGIGRKIIEKAQQKASEIGILRIFALTLEADFFVKSGFEIVEKDTLPMKVWSDCARCSKQQNCDEIAVIKGVLCNA